MRVEISLTQIAGSVALTTEKTAFYTAVRLMKLSRKQ